MADQAVRQAIERATLQHSDTVAFQLFSLRVQSIEYSKTGDTALAWLAVVDPQTGKVLAGEPGLAVLHLLDPGQGSLASSWQVSLPGDGGWLAAVKGLPEELQNDFIRDNFLGAPAALQSIAAIGGYHLPWAAGQTKNLGGSIGHFLIYNSCDINYCRYAFDFDDGTKYPLLAARGGTVLGVRWDCDDRPEDSSTPGNCTNYIALKDVSTTPTTYQIYLHLSKNTIPAGLRTLGTPVQQGQYIGNVDNTGYSFGSHVHFMVVADPYFSGTGYWWGHSIDITFDEVTVNGGRPRTCYEARNWPQYGSECMPGDHYTSANVGTNPPSGDLILPPDKTLVKGNTLLAGGWGADDLGVTRMAIIVNYDGTWREAGPAQTTNPFAFDLDLCSASIPDGPFDLALRVWDLEGNQSPPLGLRHLVKDGTCPAPPPPPTCTPTVDQVAIYAGVNFSGNCKTLGLGDFPDATTFGTVGDNQVTSIKVGDNVQAILFDGIAYTHRSETLTLSDRNLADNRIGARTISSMRVWSRATVPPDPKLAQVLGPNGLPPTSIDSLVLSWTASGATKSRVELYSGPVVGGTLINQRSWSTDAFFPVGTLAPASYTWRVQGRVADKNGQPYLSNWVEQSFSVSAASLSSPAPLAPPWSDTMEAGQNNWTATGLWHLGVDPSDGSNHTWIFNNGSDYGGSTDATGDLTSPPLVLPSASNFYVRFAYRYHTETHASHWDQRWVQISQDGGPFQNLLQLSEDVMNTWLMSPFISLAAYSGSTVRLRFHFDSLDDQYNSGFPGGGTGWFIDDVNVSTAAPPAGCNESVPDDTPAGAVPLNANQIQTVAGTICPPGDVDYYKIQAVKGENIVADVDARSLIPTSQLNSLVSISTDPDTGSLLAENDDEQPGLQVDSYLSFPVPETGTYYIRVKAHDHPGAGGPDYNYNLVVRRELPYSGNDTADPQVALTNPTPSGFLGGGPQVLTAAASDEPGGSGMSRVEFWWHSADWANGQWQLLGTDWNGADGWQAWFDASSLQEGIIYAFMARAYDRAGNAAIDVNWNAVVDRTPPVAVIQTAPAFSQDTAVLVNWDGSDAQSGLDHFEMQYNRDGAGWQDWNLGLPGTARQTWFVGQFGHQYAIRLRAVDRGGNPGAYTQTSTVFAADCQKDAYEAGPGDNTRGTARVLPLRQFETHNFCGAGDEDWIRFSATAGQHFLIWVLPDLASATDPSLELYIGGETTPWIITSAGGPGQALSLQWDAPATGDYYLRLRSLDPAVAGPGISYRLWVGTGKSYFFPWVSR